MNKLELECFECGEKIELEISEEEEEYYWRTGGTLIEGSDTYHDLFDGFGWILEPFPLCSICKYGEDSDLP